MNKKNVEKSLQRNFLDRCMSACFLPVSLEQLLTPYRNHNCLYVLAFQGSYLTASITEAHPQTGESLSGTQNEPD